MSVFGTIHGKSSHVRCMYSGTIQVIYPKLNFEWFRNNFIFCFQVRARGLKIADAEHGSVRFQRHLQKMGNMFKGKKSQSVGPAHQGTSDPYVVIKVRLLIKLVHTVSYGLVLLLG
jgi:hypothetical protein